MTTREEIIAAAQRYWRRDKWNNEYFDAAGYADFVLASRDAEIAELKSRLEYNEDGWDGIACRDETIRLLDKERDQLRAELEATRAEIAHWKNNHATEVRRARILKERIDMPIERVAAYEQWGKDQRQLAAEQVKNVALREAQFTIYKPIEPHGAQFKGAVVDGVLPWVYNQPPSSGFVASMKVAPVPDLQSDTSALEAIVKKAGEVMRERCSSICKDEATDAFADGEAEDWGRAAVMCSELISALPAVTLEDLK